MKPKEDQQIELIKSKLFDNLDVLKNVRIKEQKLKTKKYDNLEDNGSEFDEDVFKSLHLNQREYNLLLAWITGCKPDNTFRIDMIVLDKLKRFAKKFQLYEEYESFFENKEYDEFGHEITAEDKKELIKEVEDRKIEITDINGIFYCLMCRIKTNEKTSRTTCVICDEVLQRVGVEKCN